MRTFTIITTRASDFMAPLHDRMPVILDEGEWAPWLGEEEVSQGQLLGMLKPYEGDLRCWPVDKRVGNVREDDPGVIEPLAG